MEQYLVITPLGALKMNYSDSGGHVQIIGSQESKDALKALCDTRVTRGGMRIPFPPSAEYLTNVLSGKVYVVKVD